MNRTPGIKDEDFLVITSDSPEGATFDDWYVAFQAKSISLRGQVVQFDLSTENLKSRGIEMIDEELTAVELFRSVLPEYREQLHATEDELRQRVPVDLPLLLRIDEWYHPDIPGGEKPSENETFQAIAKVLVAADPTLYKVEKAPNSHWSNWPDGGTL